MKHGRYREALAAFSLFREGPAGPLMAARDMYYAHAQLEVESRLIAGGSASVEPTDQRRDLQEQRDNSGDTADLEDPVTQRADMYSYQIRATSYWQRFRQLFTVPRCRRAALCASIVMMARQITDINIIGR